MRSRIIGLLGAIALPSTMAVIGCADFSGASGTGGAAGTAGTGSSSSTGGAVGSGGGSSTGGTGAGGTGAGGASAVGSVTNLSGTKLLSALTTAEAAQLCSDAYSYFGRAISRATACKWKGLAYAISSSAPDDTGLQQACASQESTCLQANPSSPSCGALPSPCTATVADYSTCVADQATTFTQTVSGLASCSTVIRADLAAVWDFSSAATLPASCTALDITCSAIDLPSARN